MNRVLYIRREYFGGVAYNAMTAEYFRLTESQRRVLLAQASSLSEDQQRTQDSALERLTGSPATSSQPFEIREVSSETFHTERMSAPLKSFFNITKRCNLFCQHCYNDSGHESSPELELRYVRSTLLSLQRLGTFKVTLAGGEPLFHSRFEEVLETCESTDLCVTIVTNGICLNERRARTLGSSRNLRSITVSLDGATASDNDHVRGEGAFKNAMRGLQLLRAHYQGELCIRISLMQSNVERVEQLADLASHLGIREIKVNSVNSYGRAVGRTDLLLADEEYRKARDRLASRAQALGVRVEVPAQKYRVDEAGQLGLCRSGEETCEIDADGSVFPCSFSFGRFNAGNVRTSDFAQIIHNLQAHTINNPFCYACKGRGGAAEKVFGTVPPMIRVLNM